MTRKALTFLVCALGAVLSSGAQAPRRVTTEQSKRIEDILSKMTLGEKIDYIGGTGFAVRAMPKLDLPALQMSDGPVGVRSDRGAPSTAYAGGIALAATWDRELASAVGVGIGRDARARGVMYMLGPGVNIYRSPRNGRNFEYMGEDPYLAGQMAATYITGLQSQGVSATVKHFAANNSEYLRHDSDSIVDERTLREIYLPAFEAAVKQGHVLAVMDSYNLINGRHATQNGFLNNEVLRKDWKFEGTVMSDWVACYDGVAEANGGLDLEMPTGKFMSKATLLPAVKAGTVTVATIDEKVRHILTTAMMFGWLDRPQKETSIALDDPQDNAVALRSARESVTLLKNEGGLLPLDKKLVKTILVVGPSAQPGATVGGGSAAVKPTHRVSLLEGLAMTAPGVKVEYEPALPSLGDLARATPWVSAASGGGVSGVTVEMFEGRELKGKAQTATIEHMDVERDTQTVGGLDIGGRQGQTRSRRMTGFYGAAGDGEYLVAMGAVDGSGARLLVDDKLVFDNWTYKRAAEPHATIHLSKGVHKVVLESWLERADSGRAHVGICLKDSIVSAQARQLAQTADAVIVAVGFQANPKDNEDERENSDRTFDLPFGQDALISQMAAANKRTIVALTAGGAVDSARWLDNVTAWLTQWYGGQSEGQALAEAIFGDVNPAGHLPVTFERREEDNPTFSNYYPVDAQERVIYKEGIFVGYRGYEHNGVKPLFPFGYGLSYTTFAFSNLRITSARGAEASVEFDVKNTGSRAGAEVAQVYVGEDSPRVERPKHELKGFERVELAPGETKHVRVELGPRAFAYWSVEKRQWIVDGARFAISVGESVASLPLHETLTIPESVASAAPL